MLKPCVTGFGVPEVEMARSDWPAVATTVVAVARLFPVLGSEVTAMMLALADRAVPTGAAAGTFMTMGNVAEAPTPREAVVQTMSPVPPRAGVLQAHPTGGTRETNVAFTVLVGLLL